MIAAFADGSHRPRRGWSPTPSRSTTLDSAFDRLATSPTDTKILVDPRARRSSPRIGRLVSVPQREPRPTRRAGSSGGSPRWPGSPTCSVDDISIPGTTGWSNETILFDARWREGGAVDAPRARGADRADRVLGLPRRHLRRPVRDHVRPRRAAPTCRSPPCTGSRRRPEWFGSPFWIMTRVAGDIPTDTPPYAVEWLAARGLAGRPGARLVERHRGPGLGPPGRPRRPRATSVVARRPTRWPRSSTSTSGFLTWAEDGEPHPAGPTGARRAAAHRAGRATRGADPHVGRRPPEQPHLPRLRGGRRPRLGDGEHLRPAARPRVVAVRRRRPHRRCRLPAPAGLPVDGSDGRRWSTLTGRSAAALDYYELFAGLRFTVIMLRMGKLLHDMGLVPADVRLRQPHQPGPRGPARRGVGLSPSHKHLDFSG